MASKEFETRLELLAKEKELLAEESKGFSNIFNINKKINKLYEESLISKREEKLIEDEIIKNSKKGLDIGNEIQQDLLKHLEDLKKENKLADEKIKKQQNSNDLLKHYTTEFQKIFSLQAGWIKGLNDSDKIIRTTILNLGMSGKKADMMRTSFEGSAKAVALMGGSLKDIQTVQEGYANETGRARIMTAQMVQDIVAIGRGTGLGVEEATKLGAQFELMGFDARATATAVQGIVDTSERMGINTTKVLKGVNDNFKRLQQYSFQGGVKGMLQMSQYATKMNVDMNQALNAADVAKSLEGAIDLAAKLQVMGGEFAKTDPLQMLFLSRNDPAKFTEKVNDMTKGIVSFRKMADGSFEKFISPADRDRLASVAKSLNIDTGELTQQALRMADIQKMRQNMLGSSLSKQDKEIIEGAAIFNKKTGMFQVQVGDAAKNITDLNESEAKAFLSQKSTLEQRAKDSLTFQEALEAMLASFKTTLLPMLRGFTAVLTPIAKAAELINKALSMIPKGLVEAFGTFTAGAIIFAGGIKMLNSMKFLLTGKNMFSRGMAGRIANGRGNMGMSPNIGGGGNSNISQTLGGEPLNADAQRAYNQGVINRGQAAQAAGKGSMMKGAGIGMAAVGIGAGLGLAAVGIGQLAKAIKDVDVEKLKVMNTTMIIVGATMVSMGLMGLAAAPGMFAVAAAAAGIGAGIGMAAAGVGYMADGLSKLVVASKDADWGLAKVAVGIGAINLAMATTGTIGFLGGMLGGFSSLSKTIDIISSKAASVGVVGAAFKEINLAMSGSKEDFVAIQNAITSISNMNINKGSAFAQLAELLKTPIKIEFADKKVQFVSNITMEIDGQKFMHKIYQADVAANKSQDAKQTGKRS